MSRIVIALAVAILAGTLAGQAQADVVWRYPYKGTPYAVERTPLRAATLGHVAKPRGKHTRHARLAKTKRYTASRHVTRRVKHASRSAKRLRVAGYRTVTSRWHHPHKGPPYVVREVSYY